MANRNNQLKAYVRFDGTGRIVPSSLILQRFKPKVGNWQEIPATECCNNVLPSNCVEFVANTTSGGTTFYMDVSTSADITYTATWGDGTTSTGSTSEGGAFLEHSYPLEVTAAYTVQLCFSDATAVTAFEFWGND